MYAFHVIWWDYCNNEPSLHRLPWDITSCGKCPEESNEVKGTGNKSCILRLGGWVTVKKAEC